MRYLVCKCGKYEFWSSGVSPCKCQGCKECNTNICDHGPLEEHDWKIKYNSNTGVPDRRMCSKCFKYEKI